MTTFKDMTPMQRIAALRKTGVILFPKLSKDEKESGAVCRKRTSSISTEK